MKTTPVSYQKLVKIFIKAGWVHTRTQGDHLIFEKGGYLRPVVIPKYKTVPTFIIKNNLRTAQITREKYFALLK